MNSKILIFGGIATVALAVPAIAQMAMPGRPAQTRAQAEAKVRDHFAMIDADKDGFVTTAELAAMRGAAMSKMFERLDSDRNGSISRAEFDAAHAGGAGGGRHAGRMRGHGMKMGMGMGGGRLMRMADADKDGRVSLSEAVNGALALFDRADTDKDGTLTPTERQTARQAMRAAWRAKAGG